MGKKKSVGGPSKGELIAQYLAEHPDATPTQIVEGLKEQGTSVSISMVTLTKSKLRGGRKKRTGRKQVAPSTMARRPAGDKLSASDLFEAKRLADQLGGIRQARQALEVLEKLQ